MADAANGGEGERPTIHVLALPHFEQGWRLSVGLGIILSGIVDAVSTNNAPPGSAAASLSIQTVFIEIRAAQWCAVVCRSGTDTPKNVRRIQSWSDPLAASRL